MMLQKNMIPPHCGIKKGSLMNVTFPKDLSERNVNIAYHLTPLRRNDGRPRRVFINNFSAAGGNTGLLLEDAPRLKAAVPDPRGTHVIAVTAKSKSAYDSECRETRFVDSCKSRYARVSCRVHNDGTTDPALLADERDGFEHVRRADNDQEEIDGELPANIIQRSSKHLLSSSPAKGRTMPVWANSSMSTTQSSGSA